MAGALSKIGRGLSAALMILGLLFLCLAGGIGYVYLTKKGEVSFDAQKYAFKFSLEAPVEKAESEKKDKEGTDKRAAKTSDEMDFSKPAIDQLNYAQNYSLPQNYKAGEYFRAARSENLSKLEKDLELLSENMKKMQAMNDSLDAKLQAKEKEIQQNKLKISNDARRSVANILNKADIETVIGALTNNQAIPPAKFSSREEDDFYGLFFILKRQDQILNELQAIDNTNQNKDKSWVNLYRNGYQDWLKKNNLSEKDMKGK